MVFALILQPRKKRYCFYFSTGVFFNWVRKDIFFLFFNWGRKDMFLFFNWGIFQLGQKRYIVFIFQLGYFSIGAEKIYCFLFFWIGVFFNWRRKDILFFIFQLGYFSIGAEKIFFFFNWGIFQLGHKRCILFIF